MDFKENGPVFGIVGTTTVSGSLPIAEVRVGDILEGDVVCGTVTHLIEGMPVVYNLITYSSLTTPNVEKF
jgi:hypothetical protein